MPILVVCPGCGTKLNAPDSGAGKKVRCPKPGCGTLVPVPDLLPVEEVPVVDAEPLPPPKPSPVRAASVDDDEDDDDDRPSKRRRDDDDDRPRGRRRDDDDDRPRKRRRDDDEDDDEDRPRRRPRRKRSGTNPAVVVAVVLGLLLLLGGGGYVIYLLVGGGKAAPPKGWTEYTYADAGFKAYFPKEPNKRSGGRSPLGRMNGLDVSAMYEVQTTTEDGGKLMMMVGGTRLPPEVPASAAREILDKMIEEGLKKSLPDTRLSGPRSVSWMGGRGKELTMEQTGGAPRGKAGHVTMRFVVTDTHLFVAAIGAEDGSMNSRTINGFFDNIQPLK